MRFKDYLNEASSSRERTAIENYRRKIREDFDAIAGDSSKEHKYGQKIIKEIHKKYSEFQDYLYDTIFDIAVRYFIDANSKDALEGVQEFFKSINNERMVASLQKDIDSIDKSTGTKTGSTSNINKEVLSLVKSKNDNISTFVINGNEDIKFPDTYPRTISVKESVKTAAGNLFYQHKPKYFKKFETKSSKVILIIGIGSHNKGLIQHVIYDDEGTTKITSYGAFDLVTDALDGTFNDKTLTKI